jgi:hypothetical protein
MRDLRHPGSLALDRPEIVQHEGERQVELDQCDAADHGLEPGKNAERAGEQQSYRNQDRQARSGYGFACHLAAQPVGWLK